EYIRIPAKSPHYDVKWKENGHIDRAVALLQEWSVKRAIEGLRFDVVRLPGRTPVILIDVPGTSDEIVLLYGHCDKQPEMVGWAEGLGPWIPARKGDRLFGRGVGDDGYATFSALTAIEALQAARVPHARCIVLIEACEESGSYDLPAYMDTLASRIGTPSLVVCLDSGGGNVLRPSTTVKLSLRVPPTCDAERAARTLKDLLEKDPPYGAKVTYQGDGSRGWDAPPTQPWLLESADRASKAYFGKGA